MSEPVLCPRRLDLVKAYHEAAKSYANAVALMHDLVTGGMEAEVRLRRGAIREKWDVLEKARVALFRHEADHCCDRSSAGMREQS